ncbi:MAG: DUF11 domain-containing protein, partial [Verrucomicrobiota bacterium]
GDLDGDRDLDIFFVSDNSPHQVWFNDGSGTFTDSGQRFGNRGGGVQLGDLDGDGDLDAFVGVRNFEPDQIWLNDGAGTFSDSGLALGASLSQGLALGDLDADGDLDAFVSTRVEVNRVWLNGACHDIQLTQSGSPGVIVTNNLITYTLHLTNTGPVAARDVEIVDTLPPGVTPGGTVVTPVGNLAVGAFTNIIIQVTVDPMTVGVLSNHAVATMRDNDINPDDNIAFALTTVPDADNDLQPDFADPDDDNDGTSDEDERDADTDPFDADSNLRILDIASQGGAMQITWRGGMSVTQYLERADSLLGTPQWTVIFTNEPPTSITNMNLDPGAVNDLKAYYRIRVGR